MALIRAVRGDVDHGLVFSGANSWKIDKITTVHDLIQELTQDPVDETILTDASDKTIPAEQVKKQDNENKNVRLRPTFFIALIFLS